MRRKALFSLIIVVFLAGVSYWLFAREHVKLAADKNGSKQVGDFILHIRVERVDDGVQVYRSIQYMGKEPIEMKHNTPLISVSLANKNHDYTGSPVTKELEEGDSYHPQDTIIFKPPSKGKYDLHCQAKFTVNGEEMIIDHTEKLEFK
ncbi:hypothetical protein ACW2QC_05175 [Virgibacillus sp. FSP13]